MKEEYIINDDTVVVMSVSSSCCMVYENSKIFKINNSLNNIIKKSCNYYGSSFNGRLEGSKYLLGYNYKVPIILDDYKGIIFFPLKSYRDINNCIVFINNIKDYNKKGNNIIIKSKENKDILINISYGIFEKQYIKAQKLLLKIKNI